MLATGQTNAEDGRDRSAPDARSGESSSAPGSSAAARHVDEASRPPPHQPDPARQPIDFAAEYQRAYRVLWVVAAGVLGRSAGAEDVVQEAALLALGKLDQFEPGTHFAAWMAQMVRYVALNQVRRQVRGRAQSLDDPDGGAFAPVGTHEPELHLGSRGELPVGQHSFDDRLMRALEGLTEVARGCLLLRTLEGMEYEEIGRVFGIPQGTAMSHVHRSRMRLRQRLMDADPAGGACTRGGGGGGVGGGYDSAGGADHEADDRRAES
jgi:RNA polymerase sigma-70 factor (ECF subfamily)